MKKILRLISLAIEMLYRIMLECSKAVLLLMVLIVSAQVIMRTFTRESILWSEEVALLLMIWTAFFALAIGVEKSMHLSVSLFYDKFPKFMKKGATKLNDVLITMFGIALIYFGIGLISVTTTSTLPATKLPACWKYMMIPISGFFIMYFSLINLFKLDWLRHNKILKGNDEDV